MMINGTPCLMWVTTCAGGCSRAIYCSFNKETCATVSDATDTAIEHLGFELLDNRLYCAGCAREATKCPVCGEYIYPSKGRKYCSTKCATIMRRIKAGKISNQSPETGGVE